MMYQGASMVINLENHKDLLKAIEQWVLLKINKAQTSELGGVIRNLK